MNIHIRNITFALISSFALVGCLRDELQQCQPLKAHIQILERQYAKEIIAEEYDYDFDDENFNENTPFKDIVPTLYCVLHDAATGNVVMEYTNHSLASEDSSPEHTVTFPEELAFGKYVLTVWGGLDNDNQLINDKTTLDFATVKNAVFVGTDTIDFNAKQTDFNINMRRVNGKVVVETIWQTQPLHLDATYMNFTGLSSYVNSNLEYSSINSKEAQFTWTPALSIINELVLPPSVSDKSTLMNLRYFNTAAPEKYKLSVPDTYITIKRNQVTYLRYVVDPYSGSVKAYIFVHGEWREVNNMSVD